MAARAVGVSEGDILDMIARAEKNAWVKQGKDITPEQAGEAVLARLRKVYAVNQEMPGDIDQLVSIPNDQVKYGEDGNQDEIQNFGGVDKDGRIKDLGQAAEEKEKVKQKRDANVFLRRKMVGRDKEGKKQFDMEEVFIPDGQPVPDEFRDQAILRDFGLRIAGRDANRNEIVVPFREEIAPANIILGQEAARIQKGINKFGADAFPGAATLVSDIRDNLRPAPAAERALARDMVMQDARGLNSAEIEQEAERRLRLEFEDVFDAEPRIGRAGAAAAMPIDAREVRKAAIMEELGRFSPQARQDMIEANDWKRNAEAQEIARMRFGINGGGAQADEAIARIGQIQKIGHAKIGADFNVVKQMPGRQVDPKAVTAVPIDLAHQYNIPSTAPIEGQLNAGQRWLADQDPGFREDGRIFGDFPQVGINEQLNNAEQAIRNIKIKGKQVNPDLVQIKNIEGLQRAVGHVVNLGIANRQGFFDRVDGKNVHNPNPGITQVLNKARMNDNQQNNLARALMMVELAGGKANNMEGDKRFFDGVDFNNGAPVARINREKIEGREIKAALQALDGRQADPPLNVKELAQARMPFQAAIAGQAIPRAQFLKGKAVGMSPAERIEVFGPVNGEIANRLERVRNAMIEKVAPNPANPVAGEVDVFAEGLRGQDAAMSQLGEQRNAEANAREINEAFERIGLPLEGKVQMLLGGQIVQPMAVHRDPAGLARAGRNWEANPPERNLVPDDVWNNPALKGKATSAAANPQPDPIPLAVRGGWMGSNTGGRVVPSLTSTESGGAGMGGGNRPTAVAAPTPDPWDTPPATGPGISQEVAKRPAFNSGQRLLAAAPASTEYRVGGNIQPDGVTPRARDVRKEGEYLRDVRRYSQGRKFGRNAAITGGAVAGLAGINSLIGGERDRREEEAQY